jgi:hypothetical protein
MGGCEKVCAFRKLQEVMKAVFPSTISRFGIDGKRALQSGFVTISLRGALLLAACQKLCFEVAMWSRQLPVNLRRSPQRSQRGSLIYSILSLRR